MAFAARLSPGSPGLSVKVEFKDETGRDVFRRVSLASGAWSTVTLTRAQFNQSLAGSPALFDWSRVSIIALLVEEGVGNPSGAFEIDDLRLVDADGAYPDLADAADPGSGALRSAPSGIFSCKHPHQCLQRPNSRWAEHHPQRQVRRQS